VAPKSNKQYLFNRAKKGTKILRVCLDSYIKCNIKGRSVYFATGTLRKQVELLLIMVFSDQQFENEFGVPNEANKSTVVTNFRLHRYPIYTSVGTYMFKRLTRPEMKTKVKA
jgi:hypothetical protein